MLVSKKQRDEHGPGAINFEEVDSASESNWRQLIKEFNEEVDEISISAKDICLDLIKELDKMRMEL